MIKIKHCEEVNYKTKDDGLHSDYSFCMDIWL